MQSIRTGILAGVCAIMILADVALSLAYVRYAPKDNDASQVLVIGLVILPLNLPYLGACGASLTLLRQHPRPYWFFIISLLLVASLSLALRYADYTVARSVWEARLAGMHFGFCAPPPRLVGVFVDFVGVGLAITLAGTISIVASRRSISKPNR